MLLFSACNSQSSVKGNEPVSTETTNQYVPPAPNTIVAQARMPIKEDTLNHFIFSVQIVTTNYSKNGTYSVHAAYGPNIAKNEFTMPRGGSHLKPVIKKGTGPYTYIIGFYFGKEKTFYDYYQVSADKGQIEMQYIKAYTFQ